MMKKIRDIIAFLVVTALLTVGGTFALAADNQGTEFEDGFNKPMDILPTTYWHT